jgi:Ca2+-binding RTX toxin-like protein
MPDHTIAFPAAAAGFAVLAKRLEWRRTDDCLLPDQEACMSRITARDLTLAARGSAPTGLARDWLLMSRAPNPVTIPGPVTQALFNGTGGNDNFVGTAGDDGFDMGQGGNDTVSGKGGLDIFLFEDTLTAADKVNGGGGVIDDDDWLYLNGDYSAGLVFGPNTVTNMENIFLTVGHSYKLTTHDNTVAAGELMTIRGYPLGAGDDLTVDSSAETDGITWVLAGAGHDLLTGGVGDELYTFTDATLQITDRINGGGGDDALQLDGDFSAGFVFGKKTFKNIEDLFLTAGNDYDLTLHDANVAAGSRLVVYGSPLDAGETLTFDGSAETDGRFLLLGGPSSDVLIGGSENDEFRGGEGGDLLTPGKGNDDLLYFSASESGGSRYDWIFGFDFEDDQFQMPFAPVGIDDKINTGSLSPLTFSADLVAAVNASNLAADHAVLFTPDAGDLAGERFLVVDANGTAGFQSGGVDWVVRLTDAKHLSALDLADFIAL